MRALDWWNNQLDQLCAKAALHGIAVQRVGDYEWQLDHPDLDEPQILHSSAHLVEVITALLELKR